MLNYLCHCSEVTSWQVDRQTRTLFGVGDFEMHTDSPVSQNLTRTVLSRDRSDQTRTSTGAGLPILQLFCRS